jgi:hypothetical protein
MARLEPPEPQIEALLQREQAWHTARLKQARQQLERAALEQEKTRLLDAYQAEVIELTELAERRARLAEQGQLLREEG